MPHNVNDDVCNTHWIMTLQYLLTRQSLIQKYTTTTITMKTSTTTIQWKQHTISSIISTKCSHQHSKLRPFIPIGRPPEEPPGELPHVHVREPVQAHRHRPPERPHPRRKCPQPEGRVRPLRTEDQGGWRGGVVYWRLGSIEYSWALLTFTWFVITRTAMHVLMCVWCVHYFFLDFY